MKQRLMILIASWLLHQSAVADGIVVIAHPSVPRIDQPTLQRIYTGRVIEINGVTVVPLNNLPGSADRARFLRDFLLQDEEKYTGYWTVRRYIGKGAPPREVGSAAEMIAAVQSTPGAIGYVHDSEPLKPGVTLLLRR